MARVLPRFAIDAMGGDPVRAVTVPAAVSLAGRFDSVMVGDPAQTRSFLPAHSPVAVHAATQVASPSDSLSDVLRHRADAQGVAGMARHLVDAWLAGLWPLQRASLVTARRALAALGQQPKPQRYNGASFMGLSGVVVKSHGASDVEGFRRVIEEAAREVTRRLPHPLAAGFAGRN